MQVNIGYTCDNELLTWPNILLKVEKSLLSGVQTGMVLEVPDKHDPTCYWLASVSMACGPLLRLRYLGQGDLQDRGFWCDLNKMSVHPLGWGEPRGLRMAAPSELGTGGANLREMVRKEVEGAKTVPAELLSGVSIFFLHHCTIDNNDYVSVR